MVFSFDAATLASHAGEIKSQRTPEHAGQSIRCAQIAAGLCSVGGQIEPFGAGSAPLDGHR
jgi:hypothetical protein